MLHIAERHPGLLPSDAGARARAITWMFAALTTVEPPIVDLSMTTLFDRDRSWYAERRPVMEQRVRDRLAELSHRLGQADWLDGAFSAGDLLIVSVLRRLRSSGLLRDYPNVAGYVGRGEERAAFKRAFEAQLAVFSGSASNG